MRVFVKAKGNESYSDRAVVVSAREDVRRLLQREAAYRDALQPEVAYGDALPPEAASSSISSGLSIVGKIVGRWALAIFGHVEREIRASTVYAATRKAIFCPTPALEASRTNNLRRPNKPK